MILKKAIELNSLGLRVIPVGDNKRPTVSWKKYQEGQTKADVLKIFNKSTDAIAMLTGEGIEVLDIDSKYFLERHKIEHVFDLILEAVGEETYQRLVITETRSGGYHVVYRTDIAEGNQKLASRYTTKEERSNEHDKYRVLLETRGVGGYILIPPSKGYRFDREGLNLSCVPYISNDQRNALISACMTFDELEETYTQSKAATPVEVQGAGKSTIEAFCEAHTCAELLEQHGWQRTRGGNRGNIHYVRPGKTLRDGHGAGYHPEKNLVRIFTTSSCFPIEGAGSTFNAFQTYSHLEHGGDYKSAARELYKLGYGERLRHTKATHRESVEHITSSDKGISEKVTDDALMSKIYNGRIDVTVKPRQKPSTIFMKCSRTEKYIGIGGGGDLVNIFGGEKSGKSSLASCMASCFLEGSGTGQTSLNFKADFEGKNLLHFDTEQKKFDHHRVCVNMLNQQAISTSKHPKNLFSFHLLPFNKLQRLSFLKYAIENTPNIGAVFLDGIVDICRNYNDLEESSDLVTFLMNMASKKNFVLLSVLHNARSTGQARGHLGTELLNKGACNVKISKEEEASHYSTCSIKNIRGRRAPEGFDFAHDEAGQLIIY